MQDIANEKIKLYEFPDCDDDENKINKNLQRWSSFCSCWKSFYSWKRNEKNTRVRQYQWGTVDGKIFDDKRHIFHWRVCFSVEDEAHSDFIALRSMLIRTNLNDLRDVTHNIHYENYRYKKWQNIYFLNQH